MDLLTDPWSLKLQPGAVVVSELILGLLLLSCSSEGQSQETAPSVSAVVGDDVVLPCYLDVPVEATQITLEWAKPELEPRFVYVWHAGREHLVDQNVAYKGRASLSVEKLKDGDVSLRLSDVRHSDNGAYRCYMPKENQEHSVQLLVGSVSSPGISLAGLDEGSSGVMLDCRSAGWFPEPELFWLDSEGELLSGGATETSRGSDGLYTVSSRVTVEKRHQNHFTCRVHQNNINQTRETHLHVPDDFFISCSDCSVSISLTVVFSLMLLLAASIFIWKRRRTSKKKRGDPETEEQRETLLKERSKLEEELRNMKKDQERVIDSLGKMKEELEEHRKQQRDMKEEEEREFEEVEKKIKRVDDRVSKNRIDKIQGYRELREIMTDKNEKVNERKKKHQQFDLKTDKLVQKTEEDFNRMKEKKQEVESHLEEMKKQPE